MQSGIQVFRIDEVNLSSTAKLGKFVFDLLQCDEAGPMCWIVFDKKIQIAVRPELPTSG
jgi:hypothetical protein